MSDFKKGMILAAGLGTRLLPITKKMPKPMVPVLNIPNILFGLETLKRAGIKEVILNLHHLPYSLENYLADGKQFGMHIEYSRENTLLGTGGGLKKAESFFDKDSFALVNCDFISNIDIKPYFSQHNARGAWASMILHQDETIQQFYAKVGCDTAGRLISLPRCETAKPVKTGIFTGVHLLSPEIFRFLEETPSGINEVLYPRLMKEFPDKAGTFFTENNYWYDTGERFPFWRSSMALLDKLVAGDSMLRDLMTDWLGYEEVKKGVWVFGKEKVPADVEIHGPVILGKNLRVAPKSVLGPYAILADDCSVPHRAEITKTIAMPGSTLTQDRVADCLWHGEALLPL